MEGNSGGYLPSREASEHGARVQFSPGTNAKTPFFQVLTPVFGKSARVWLQCLELNDTWLLVVLSV